MFGYQELYIQPCFHHADVHRDKAGGHVDHQNLRAWRSVEVGLWLVVGMSKCAFALERATSMSGIPHIQGGFLDGFQV